MLARDKFVLLSFGGFEDALHPLDERLAISAARLRLDRRLAMAETIIYATALDVGAQLVTGDAHFKGLPGVTVY